MSWDVTMRDSRALSQTRLPWPNFRPGPLLSIHRNRFLTFVLERTKHYPISDRSGWNLCSISDHKGPKTTPFGAAYTDIVCIREYTNSHKLEWRDWNLKLKKQM